MSWIKYKFNRNKKNQLEQRLANSKVFYSQKLISQKLTECVSFWAQKLTLWARDTISPADNNINNFTGITALDIGIGDIYLSPDNILSQDYLNSLMIAKCN